MLKETRINTCHHCGKYDWACPGHIVYKTINEWTVKGWGFQCTYEGLIRAANEIVSFTPQLGQYSRGIPGEVGQMVLGYLLEWVQTQLNSISTKGAGRRPLDRRPCGPAHSGQD